jgi:CheY-like chemotaxis protein
MRVSPELLADVEVAVADLAFVEGVHELQPHPEAREHPDALLLAIVLSPYTVRSLVQVHYSVLRATEDRQLTGRVLYVNADQPTPFPMRGAVRVKPSAGERERAMRRLEERTRRTDSSPEASAAELKAIETAFAELVARAAHDPTATVSLPPGSPYRPEQHTAPALKDQTFHSAISAGFAPGAILEVVPDPFPSPPRKRILVADEDPATSAALRALREFDVVQVSDGWSAIDELVGGAYDLAICALNVGEFPGVKIYRMVAKSRPDVASRIYFLTEHETIAQAPPSTARNRILSRPLSPEAVLRVLAEGRA